MMLTTTFLEVWAIPGAHSIIDTINPVTGLTSVYAKDAAAVLAEDPNAVRMSWQDWRAAAIARQQTPIRWIATTGSKYREMLEILPPALWLGGAFLVGEPWDHCHATGAPRFAAYVHRAGRYYVASRPMTCAELRAAIGR